MYCCLPSWACFGLSSINNKDDMIFEVLNFVTKAAKDCMIRAKDVMMNVSAEQRPTKPVLHLDRRVIAMGMGGVLRAGDTKYGKKDIWSVLFTFVHT